MKKTTKRKLVLGGEIVKVLAITVDRARLGNVHGGRRDTNTEPPHCTDDDSGCGSIIRTSA
jgi:hypothetical protein